jgi:hypothetical protein
MLGPQNNHFFKFSWNPTSVTLFTRTNHRSEKKIKLKESGERREERKEKKILIMLK